MSLLTTRPAARSITADVAALLDAKASQRVAACIPARNEATTIAAILDVVVRLRDLGVIDDVVVVDDASCDGTSVVARSRDARVVPSTGGPGKGQALTAAVANTDADALVFLDADVTNFSSHFVTDLLVRLFTENSVQLVKATYRRPCHGRADEGGRVTELLARPLLRRFFPDLAQLAQPLAGECAIRRRALEGIVLADGYGIEIGLLIDISRRFGRDAIREADLGERVHRNRPLHELRPHADDIIAAVLDRTHLATEHRGAHP